MGSLGRVTVTRETPDMVARVAGDGVRGLQEHGTGLARARARERFSALGGRSLRECPKLFGLRPLRAQPAPQGRGDQGRPLCDLAGSNVEAERSGGFLVAADHRGRKPKNTV